ncbi:MAG: hypothetical protein ACJ79S_12005 [Gemmatimonadaceae bacterium]
MSNAHRSPSIRTAVLAASAVLLVATLPGGAAAQQRRASAPPASVAPPPEGWSRAPRWQAALSDGSYLWEITPAGLRGDTLLARQGDSVLRVPLERVAELRLLRATERGVVVGAGGGAAHVPLAVLDGADDAVFELARFPVAERRRLVERILADYPPAAAAKDERGRP